VNVVYRATAESGMSISGTYRSFDQAFGMLHVFAGLVSDIVSHSAARHDLEFNQPE